MSGRDEVLHEFEAGRQGTVRTRVSEFHGKTRLDLRLWVEPREQPGGDLVPTQKGINVPVEYLDELEDALAAVRKAAGQKVRSA